MHKPFLLWVDIVMKMVCNFLCIVTIAQQLMFGEGTCQMAGAGVGNHGGTFVISGQNITFTCHSGNVTYGQIFPSSNHGGRPTIRISGVKDLQPNKCR